jgi:GxxExxY protein
MVDVSGGSHDYPSVERNGGDLLLRVYRPLMNVNERELIEVAVGAAYEVSNTLGCGFLERVYERAMIRELAARGLSARGQVSYAVSYKGFCVGEYFADIVVENCLVVELKCVDRFSKEHLAQCLNYLKASGLKSALLVNFQRPKVEWRHVVSRF